MHLKRVAIAQINSVPNPLKNFETIQNFAHNAKANGAKMMCLPENFNFMGKSGEGLIHHQPLTGEFIERYRQLARDASIWLSLGGFLESSTTADKYYNTHIIISETGEIKAVYRKIHLFDVKISEKLSYNESKFIIPGEKIPDVIETPIGKIGISICYDLRFPELYRKLALKGAQILLIPAAFLEKTGYAHWEVLLRARAIENTCYVIASAQDGVHDGGRISYGHSFVIDPWGNVIANAGEKSKLIYADIDLEYLEEVRRRIPSLEHIRLMEKL